MKRSTFDAYSAQLGQVLAYIDAHLDDDLSIDALSHVAGFSKYHFCRQFSALYGLSVYKYVQLSRLKRASHQLAFCHQLSIVEIALASDYENHESFSRAFKQIIGQTPSDFRSQPHWPTWHSIYQPLNDLRRKHMTPNPQPQNVKITHFPATKVAALEHHGDPTTIEASVAQFIQWRKQNHLPPHTHATFNILYNDPAQTPPADFRLDICTAIAGDVAENDFGIVAKTIPAGRCAVLRYIGDDANLGASITYLYSQWLPTSGEALRDFPLFLQRIKFFPEVPDHETVIDIFLPLK